jgi:hypothetical protein
MERVCIYLRKSRKDEEIEKELGQREALLKHRTALLKYAREKGLNITNIYEELVSGESLIFRIEMQKLLADVKDGLFDAVLVMDKDRLGRDDMEEQGYILNVFKKSNTKIMTPMKTYDLVEYLKDKLEVLKLSLNSKNKVVDSSNINMLKKALSGLDKEMYSFMSKGLIFITCLKKVFMMKRLFWRDQSIYPIW